MADDAPRDYDTPKTPEATPPAIDPDVKPKSSDEMAAEGEKEGDVLKDRSEDDIETERHMAAAQDGGRDGQGESGLDASPETLLPPD